MSKKDLERRSYNFEIRAEDTDDEKVIKEFFYI